jgi:hypothetical protein
MSLADYYRDKEHDPNITGMIIHTYSYFMNALIWHFSPYDQSQIKKVPNNIHLYLERMSERVESSYFGRKFIDEGIFNEELINPFY